MTDVLVVGGGLAGWMAATAAQEGGRRVTLVERSERLPGYGNSVMSGGALHAVLRDPASDPAELLATITRLTAGRCDPDVAAAWAENAARTIAWIRLHGGELLSDPAHSHRAAVFTPVKPTVPGLAFDGYGTVNFLLHLREHFLARGGVLLQPARAVGLDRDGDQWRVTVDSSSGRRDVAANAVILADGGFQGDREEMRRHVGTDSYKLRAADSSTGDGLRMGLANGGVAVEMRGFYGHLLAREALTRDDLWPYPILDLLASTGIIVASDGTRIVDESIGGVRSTNAVACSHDPLGCWLIVDDDGWNREGCLGTTPPNPYLLDAGSTVIEAATLETLAARSGIAWTGLRRVAAQLTDPEAAVPPRRGTLRLARPPFRAIPLVAGVSFTLGGLKVDGRARVLSASGEPVAGLYAAGGTMGGLHGGPDVGYAGGLLEAAVFGLLAGEDASR